MATVHWKAIVKKEFQDEMLALSPEMKSKYSGLKGQVSFQSTPSVLHWADTLISHKNQFTILDLIFSLY